MIDILFTMLVALLIIAGLLGLARFARHDTFAGPSLRYQPHDDLGYRYSAVIGKPS